LTPGKIFGFESFQNLVMFAKIVEFPLNHRSSIRKSLSSIWICIFSQKDKEKEYFFFGQQPNSSQKRCFDFNHPLSDGFEWQKTYSNRLYMFKLLV
jgi:hypothetical protein